MRKLIVFCALLLGIAGTASAQVALPVPFDITNGKSVTPNVTFNGADTSAIIDLATIRKYAVAGDTTLSLFVRVKGDTARASWYARYFCGPQLIGVSAADSLTYNNLASLPKYPARAMNIWATRPAGTTGVQIVINWGNSLNHGAWATAAKRKFEAGVIFNPTIPAEKLNIKF